jgi:hypothetical protein
VRATVIEVLQVHRANEVDFPVNVDAGRRGDFDTKAEIMTGVKCKLVMLKPNISGLSHKSALIIGATSGN